MSSEENQNIIDALQSAFGLEPWLLGDSLKKAPVKKALSKSLRKPAAQLRNTDLKNLMNDLWSAGLVEIIPPKDQERSFKYRVTAPSPTPTEPIEPSPAEAASPLPIHSHDDNLIVEAYSQLRQESQFRHVYLADICEKSGLSVEIVHQWASQKARNREFELGQADWSLATERQRDAAIKINGIHYLTVGLLS